MCIMYMLISVYEILFKQLKATLIDLKFIESNYFVAKYPFQVILLAISLIMISLYS